MASSDNVPWTSKGTEPSAEVGAAAGFGAACRGRRVLASAAMIERRRAALPRFLAGLLDPLDEVPAHDEAAARGVPNLQPRASCGAEGGGAKAGLGHKQAEGIQNAWDDRTRCRTHECGSGHRRDSIVVMIWREKNSRRTMVLMQQESTRAGFRRLLLAVG